MNQKLNKDLLERFFQKECTLEEANKVIDWLNDPENQNAVDGLLNHRWSRDANESGVKGALDVVYKRIKQKTSQKLQMERKLSRYGYYWGIAAAFALIIASIVFFVNPNPAPNTYAIVSEDGKRISKSLPDGSIVHLNGASSISLTDQFNSKDRHIKLSGEAYFEVASNSALPFIVESGPVFTEAVGTAFNVNAQPDADKIRVSLVEGKVRIRSMESGNVDERILAAGEEIAYTATGEYLNGGKLKYKDIAWKDGILVLDEVDVNELEYKLEQWYGVEVLYENKPLKNWRFTSEYDNESLKNVLEGLKFSKNMNYVIKNDSVIINFIN